MTEPNIPLSKAGAINIIEAHFRMGQFATSPPNVPSMLWKDAGRQVANESQVTFEAKVEQETDIATVRLNRGFPKGIEPFSDTAKEWASTQPGWLETQRQWHDRTIGC